jgi:hypothetical protein
MSECGITNLGSCIWEKLAEFIVNILNAPLQPLLDWIKDLMTAGANLQLFAYLWAVVIYILSLFYGLFVLYAGFNFMISGYDVEKRENAKSWIRNVIIMMVLVQASYYLYSIALDINAGLTAGVFSMIDPNFFLLTVDNLPNFALQLLLGVVYAAVLIVTLIVLCLRYMLINMGVVLFPIAIFFYFVPFLKEYGSCLLNILLSLIFLGFIQSIILLSSSMMMGIESLQNLKIVVMICAFLLVLISTFIVVKFAATKSMGLPMRKIIKLVRR